MSTSGHTRTAGRVVGLLLLTATVSPLHAQWLNHPTPGIPRTADGKANLSAAAPHTADGKPDFSGIWGFDAGPYAFFIAGELKPDEIKPAVQTLVRERSENLKRDDQFIRCLPEGPRFNHILPFPRKIVQTPNLIVVLGEDMSYRQIFMDGRALPKDPSPSFMGYSVGRWDGDTLVIESTGFKEATWLDFAGHPHTEALRLTERWRRIDFGHIEIQERFDDPELYSRPITVRVNATYIPDTELLEYVCPENEKDKARLVGTLSQIQKSFTPATVDPKVLAQYVGTYHFFFPENPTVPMVLNLVLMDGTLRLGGAPLIPMSETKFLWGSNPMEFKKDARGRVTHFVTTWVEGDLEVKRVGDK